MWSTSENVNNQNKENSLNEKQQIIEREQLLNSPFWLIKTEAGWFLVMGENRISEVFKHKHEVKYWLANNQWQVIMQLIVIVTNKINQDAKQTKKTA